MTPEQLEAGKRWAADRRRRMRLLTSDRDRWAAYSLHVAETETENTQIQRGGNR